MTKVKSVITVLQYKSYLQYGITEFTGHKITMKKTKCLVKFAIQVVGQEKKSKNKKKSQFEKLKFHVKSLVQSRSFLLRKI